jgi:Ca2+-binding EF-hand superfamily protein
MSVISFFNDLGIIPNKGTGLEKNENLLQGQQFMEYGRHYKNNRSLLVNEGFVITSNTPSGTTTTYTTSAPQTNIIPQTSVVPKTNITIPMTTPTLTAPTTTITPPAAAPMPTATAPMPTATAPMPTATAPMPTATAPMPTATAPMPTATAPVPTATAPVPTATATVPTAPKPAFDINSPEEIRKRDPYGLNSLYSINNIFRGFSNSSNRTNVFSDDTFGLLDKDNDNKITKKEFDVFLENKLNQLLNDDKLTPEQKNKMKILFEEYKQQLYPTIFKFEDKNKDGVISWEEYTGPKMNVKQIFNSMDENKDGKLTLNEINNWKKTNANDVNFDTNSFFNNLLDTNKDGVLTTDEIYNNSNQELYRMFEKDPEYKARQDALSKSASAPTASAPTSSAPMTTPSPPPISASTTPTSITSPPFISSSLNSTIPYSEYKNEDSGLNLDATTKEPVNQKKETIIARRDHSVLETRSNKYQYIAWIFVAIFIIWAFINASMFTFSEVNINSSDFTPSQNASNVFSMIIIIILVIISVLVINRMNSSSLQTNVKIFGK